MASATTDRCQCQERLEDAARGRVRVDGQRVIEAHICGPRAEERVRWLQKLLVHRLSRDGARLGAEGGGKHHDAELVEHAPRRAQLLRRPHARRQAGLLRGEGDGEAVDGWTSGPWHAAVRMRVAWRGAWRWCCVGVGVAWCRLQPIGVIPVERCCELASTRLGHAEGAANVGGGTAGGDFHRMQHVVRIRIGCSQIGPQQCRRIVAAALQEQKQDDEEAHPI